MSTPKARIGHDGYVQMNDATAVNRVSTLSIVVYDRCTSVSAVYTHVRLKIWNASRICMSLSTLASDDCSTLHKQKTSELDKYLQEAAEKHEAEDNYFDGCHTSTNTSPLQQEDNYLEEDNINIDNAPKPTIPKSHEQDTGLHHINSSNHQTQLQDNLATMPKEGEDDEKQIDPTDQDTLVFDSEESDEEPFNTTIDTTSDDSAITMGKPVTTAFISNLIQIPTEQVGCLQVTSQLQEYLDQYLPKSTEKAFEHIYQILQVLEKYLGDNLKQHQHCMSPDSEYITLIAYATILEIDLCNFLAIWAVLSILLDTMSSDLQYYSVYNRYSMTTMTLTPKMQ